MEGPAVPSPTAMAIFPVTVPSPVPLPEPSLGLPSTSLTTGTLFDLSSTSTAGGASGVSKLLDISRSGTNSNASHTAYGLYSAVTNTVTISTDVGGYFSA